MFMNENFRLYVNMLLKILLLTTSKKVFVHL